MVAATEWTPDLIDRLCGEIASGRAVTDICKEKWCPSEPTVYRKMAADPDFRAQVDAARAAQQDYEADACVQMADAATPEDWQVVKLRIWARQWRAAKLAPKKYGDRTAVDLAADVNVNSVAKLDTEQLEQMVAEKLSKLGLGGTGE